MQTVWVAQNFTFIGHFNPFWIFKFQNCLVICDRGLMDASAYIEHPQWLELLKKLNLQEESMCEDRYHHVVHMVSAAYGAEDFYSGM